MGSAPTSFSLNRCACSIRLCNAVAPRRLVADGSDLPRRRRGSARDSGARSGGCKRFTVMARAKRPAADTGAPASAGPGDSSGGARPHRPGVAGAKACANRVRRVSFPPVAGRPLGTWQDVARQACRSFLRCDSGKRLPGAGPPQARAVSDVRSACAAEHGGGASWHRSSRDSSRVSVAAAAYHPARQPGKTRTSASLPLDSSVEESGASPHSP